MTDGLVDGAWFTARQDEYLSFATERFEPSLINNVIAHAERSRRDPSHDWDRAAVTPASLGRQLQRITTWEDCGDFEVLYLVNLLAGYRDQLDQGLIDAVEGALLGFGYWFTEPTPEGIVDQKYYWSENHRIIFHTCEYLVGQLYPDAIFSNDGRTGAAHHEEARERILRWLAEKADLGFSEWHSDVYYQKDVTPLLTLVEWAADDEVATRAAMILDLVLFDIALHLHRGNFGATHGRSYMKDKSKAADQNTFDLAKLLFDDADGPYRSRSDPGATLLARSQRYRLPEVLRRVAAWDGPMIDRERMGIPIDPTAPLHDDPEAPYGYSFRDPADLGLWWERGAQPAWQVLPMTLEAVDRYGLWDTPTYSAFKPMRDIVGDDVRAAQELVHGLARVLSFGLLNEANTITYRTADVMLSTVLDFRPGTYGDQHHVWQATLDAEAVVFTTHPKNEPFPGADSWPDADGYWTGSGSLPRSVQHGAAGITMYAPRVPAKGPLAGFDHLPFTHAWFPTERFDEVRRDGHWTFGRRAAGFVALWSWRLPEWRIYEAGEVFTDGLTGPFDLVAPGGPDNVWVVEVGDASSGACDDVSRALAASSPEVRPRPPTADGFPGGFDVRFASPSQGELVVGQDGPFTVAGTEVPLRHDLRYDNPWAQVPFRATTYVIGDEQGELRLDFGAGTRAADAGS